MALLVVNLDDEDNRAFTIPMGGSNDDTISIENSCCVSIPLAMISADSARHLRDGSVSQIALSAVDCYATRVSCPTPAAGLAVPASCSGCHSGHVEDCNGVCRDSTRLGDGFCDIGNDVSGSTDFACSRFSFDLDDCSPDTQCADDTRWRDPIGRGCAHIAYQAEPGACGVYEDSFIACPRTCGTCEGACNALWNTATDRTGTGGSCARLSKTYGIVCDELVAAGVDCGQAAFCGYCGQPPQECNRGWELDCDGHCAPWAWVGDGVCDNGRATAYNFNCQAHWWDNGDCEAACAFGCGHHAAPRGCAAAPAEPVLQALSGTRNYQILSMNGGYGQNWECLWQISCPAVRGRQEAAHVRFLEFSLEAHFDTLEAFDRQQTQIVSVHCDSTCREQHGCSSLQDNEETATCERRQQMGHCSSIPLFMLANCHYTCNNCAVPPTSAVTQPVAVLTGEGLPEPIAARGGVISLRLTTDDHVGGEGFALQYWCGPPPPPPPPPRNTRTASCAQDSRCVRGQCIDLGRGTMGCKCPFGWEGETCAVSGLIGTGDRSCEQQLVDIAETVTAVCCGPGTVCNGGVPARCDHNCAAVWMPFRKSCSAFLDGHFRQFSAFSTSCEATLFSPPVRSAITAASPWRCDRLMLCCVTTTTLGEHNGSTQFHGRFEFPLNMMSHGFCRCDAEYWAAGVAQLVTACCPARGAGCAMDGSRLPKVCPSGQCEAVSGNLRGRMRSTSFSASRACAQAAVCARPPDADC